MGGTDLNAVTSSVVPASKTGHKFVPVAAGQEL